MTESRTKNSFKNIIVNNIYQFLNIILSFASRTIFIKTLGENFLGLNGLFTNILSVLSLAELGIGTAMVYSMYKPISENNEEKLTQLIGYYKVLYRRIAIIVLILGILILPILPYIVNLDTDIGNIQIYYLLYLLNSVFSYLLLYKSSIITASQKEYLIKKYDIAFLLIKTTLQILVLLFLKSFILYLIVQILTTLLTNILKSKKAEKLYSFIKEKKELPNEDKKEIWKNIKSLLYYQIGNVLLNNTDNILISVILGTVLVGHYSNYSMIVMSVSTFTALIFTSLQSSLGNFNVNSNNDEKYNIYKILTFMAFIIYSFCSISMLILFQDFITLWIGKEYLLETKVLIVIVINYYITGILYPNWCYRYTTDLFNRAKYIMILCAILNIVLSIILGFTSGLFGILLATGLSRLITTFWYEPYIMYKNIFNKKLKDYFLNQLKYILIFIIISFIIYKICSYIILSNLFIQIILKEFASIIIICAIYWIMFRKSQEYIFLKEKIINIFKRKEVN